MFGLGTVDVVGADVQGEVLLAFILYIISILKVLQNIYQKLVQLYHFILIHGYQPQSPYKCVLNLLFKNFGPLDAP
jgi:hypothetical protein